MEHVTQIVLDAKSHTVTLSIYILTKKRENERVRRGRGLSLSLSLSLSLRCNIYYFHRLLTVCWKKTKHLLDAGLGLFCLMLLDGHVTTTTTTSKSNTFSECFNFFEMCFSKRSRGWILNFQMCCEVWKQKTTLCKARTLCICFASRCTGLIKIDFRR